MNFQEFLQINKEEEIVKHLVGGKVTRSHSTAIDVVGDIVRPFLENMAEVTAISLGVIEQIKSHSCWSVKLTDCTNSILIQARQSSTTQEIRVLTNDSQAVMLALAIFIRNKGWKLRFGKRRI